MKTIRSLATILVWVTLMRVAGLAQGVGTSGDIKGRVTDPSGAAAPNATVVAEEVDKGVRRTAVSDADGYYHVPNLSPAEYNLTTELAGFQSEVQKNVAVNIGQVAIVDVRLRLAALGTQIEVNSEPPIVETEKAQQADTISGQSIQNLPIDRRDYLTFVLLMPGVTDSRTIGDNTDFRVTETPQSGLSFYGSNGRGNSVMVDGGEANDDAGGVRLTVSQDAVQEFQINRSNYSAELGSASGASINIVTKSGTSQVHGSTFGFFRDDALDARDPFAFGPALVPGQAFSLNAKAPPIKPVLNRQQFGGSLGFPIRQSKTFLFVAYEGLRRNEQASVPLLTSTSIFGPTGDQTAILNGLTAEGGTQVPCENGQAPIAASACARNLSARLTLNPTSSPLNGFIVNQFEQNGGLFPFTATSDLASMRLDHQFNDRNQVYVRLNSGRDHERNPNVQALTGFSRGHLLEELDSTLQGAWFHQFSTTAQNEARAQWNYSTIYVIPNDPGGPGLDIAGFGFLGRDIFLPSYTAMHRYETADNLILVRGHHTMKIGGYLLLRHNRSESHTVMSGRFSFGELPGLVLSPCLQVPTDCGLSPALKPSTIDSLQSLALGLPQFYQQGFGSPTVMSTNPFAAWYLQDSWALRPNLTLNFGARYELDVRYAPLNTDKDNFAPRVSFAWDPFKDHKTVVRGGYGIFYAPTYFQIDYVVHALGEVKGIRQISQVFIPLTGAPGNPSLTSATVFGTLFAQRKINCGIPSGEACITPADLTQFGVTVSRTGPPPPLSVLFSGAADFQNPYSQHVELGIERQLAPELSFSLSYIYAHTLRLPRSVDTNLLPAPLVPAGPANIPFRDWNAPQCQTNPFSCFVDPLLLQNNVYTSSASAVYNGGILELKKRFSNRATALVDYTYSKALDDVTDYNSDFAANDQTNLPAERGLSDFDARHKIVVTGVFESPWKGASGGSFASHVLSGFILSPSFRGNSSRPFSLLTGTDVNGDRHPTTDRPPGAGRNTGIGPDFYTFDMRLSRRIGLGEKAGLKLVVEAFNLLNRTNYISVNNTVGLIGPPFNLKGTSATAPSQPLGFTSAQPKREIQLGLRLDF